MVRSLASLRGVIALQQGCHGNGMFDSSLLRSIGTLTSSHRQIHISASSPKDDDSIPDKSAAAETNPSHEASSSSTAATTDYSSLIPRIVVFGGSGFVGTRICEQAIRMGADVVSVSRHGRPSWVKGPWADAVHWERGDALEPEQGFKHLLEGATGVVSTLGAFGSNEFMYRVCGTANMVLMDAAASVGVPRFSFISVHDYQFPGGWHAQDFLLKGYFQGKRDAEQHLSQVYPETGVALRPGFIYGSRHAGSGNMTIPLGLIGAPLAAALKLVPTKSLSSVPILGAAFVPPTKVETVGKAAASSVLDDGVEPGIMDVWAINKYA